MVKILCDDDFNFFIKKKNGFLYVAKSICYAVSPAWRACWKIPGKAMLTISTVLTVNCLLKVGNSFLYFFSFLTKVTFEVSRSTSSHYKVSLFKVIPIIADANIRFTSTLLISSIKASSLNVFIFISLFKNYIFIQILKSSVTKVGPS